MNITERIKRKTFNLIGSVINGLLQKEAKLTDNLNNIAPLMYNITCYKKHLLIWLRR